MQNKLREALETAQQIASAMPSSADAQALIGDVLLRNGEIAAASAAFTKAINIDACSATAQFGIGRINDLISNHELAARKFKIAHQLAPSDPEITSAFLNTLPEVERVAALRDLLASHPSLPPLKLNDLAVELAILEQKKSCTVTKAFSSATVQLAPLMFNGRVPRDWGTKIQVNQSAAQLFELDSSVSGIVLSANEAERVGVRPLLANQPSDSYVGSADQIRIGSLEFDNCPVTVVPASALTDHSLLGTDFFKDHLIHIDFVSQLMTLDPFPNTSPGTGDSGKPSASMSGWSRIYLVGNNLLLPTLINDKGPYLFLLDTGTYSSVISPAIAKTELAATEDLTINLIGTSAAIVKVMARAGGPSTDHPMVYGPSGELLPILRPRKNAAYTFAGNKYGDLFPISFDLSTKSRNTGVEIGGLLGFGVLQNYSIDINYRDSLVRIAYDQNRRYWARYVEKHY